MKRRVLSLLFVLVALVGYGQKYATRIIKDKLFIPWEIIYGPDDHIWFTQKNGYICRLDPVSKKLDTLLHVTENVINGEGGMLGMALHPSFSANPYVYVIYEYNKAGNYTEKVVRFTYSGSSLGSPMVLLDDIKGAGIHNGARLLIVDNKLFISTGDAANPANGQNLASVNGKTLRINLDGSIPADNPISGSPLWNWGQRNVQGMVYAHGKLYSSMHGAGTDDEINILLKGRNYGWPTVEGLCDKPSETTFCTDSNVVEPIYTWTPTIAPAGLDFYDHPMFSDLRGSLIMATLKQSRLYQLKLNATFDDVTLVNVLDSVKAGRLRDVCISPAGSIFISTSNSSASGGGGFTDQIIELYTPDFTHVREAANTLGVQIRPNPSDGRLRIQPLQTLDGAGTYLICSTDGRILHQGNLEPAGQDLDISDLPTGLYLLHLYHPVAGAFVTKVIRN